MYIHVCCFWYIYIYECVHTYVITYQCGVWYPSQIHIHTYIYICFFLCVIFISTLLYIYTPKRIAFWSMYRGFTVLLRSCLLHQFIDNKCHSLEASATQRGERKTCATEIIGYIHDVIFLFYSSNGSTLYLWGQTMKFTPPRFNSGPWKKWWLEGNPFLLGRHIFRGFFC